MMVVMIVLVVITVMIMGIRLELLLFTHLQYH